MLDIRIVGGSKHVSYEENARGEKLQCYADAKSGSKSGLHFLNQGVEIRRVDWTTTTI